MSGAFKKIRRKFWLILNIGVVFWMLMGLLCLQVPPYKFWPAGFLAFSLPGAMVLNFLFLLYWLFRRSWAVALPLAALALSWNYHARLFPINFGEEPVAKGANTLQVLSYNVHMFNAYGVLDGTSIEGSKEMIDWVATHPADVYCLQEFYTKRNSSVFNTVSKIGTRYNKRRYFSVARVDREKGNFGIAIFSKYPIIDKGMISFSEVSSANRAVWADLNVKGDTVRIYAVHLQSMSIKAEDIENTYTSIGDQSNFEKEGKNLARRLRKGFVARGHQVEKLLQHIRESPYDVIVTGDFNDIPFSYTYNEMAKELNNSFVVAGNGVGSTYNGPLPFLRIDNQFYSKGLRAYEFRTHHEMGFSDHFPISAKYVLGQDTTVAR